MTKAAMDSSFEGLGPSLGTTWCKRRRYNGAVHAESRTLCSALRQSQALPALVFCWGATHGNNCSMETRGAAKRKGPPVAQNKESKRSHKRSRKETSDQPQKTAPITRSRAAKGLVAAEADPERLLHRHTAAKRSSPKAKQQEKQPAPDMAQQHGGAPGRVGLGGLHAPMCNLGRALRGLRAPICKACLACCCRTCQTRTSLGGLQGGWRRRGGRL